MPIQYEPKAHIQHLEIAPRAEGVLDQREITIQSYQTTAPFNYDALNAGLGAAWLTPQNRLGVFSRGPRSAKTKNELTVVLGLQDDLSVRAYDYDHRRPLWFSWKDLIVETVSIRYSRDVDGLLRFTTTGGGRRITDERLHDFNNSFLKIPKDAVSKRHFDLAKLRELCFGRFINRLYMLRFSDPSGEEYRSIDHALFQSRLYIDPQAERLHEIQADTEVTIQEFDSDIDVRAKELSGPLQVRFFIRGQSGSLRLRFPKISYKTAMKTPEEQSEVFYRLVEVAANSILDADYYTQQRRSLEELDTELGMFPDMVDLVPFREVLSHAEARAEFISSLDLGAPPQKWLPHLQALDELIFADVVAAHVAVLTSALAKNAPPMAASLITVCQSDPKMHRLGAVVAGAVGGTLQAIPAELRGQVETRLLSWAIDREHEAWQLDPDTGEITVLNLRWQLTDLSLDVLPAVLWKLVGVLQARLLVANGNTATLLRQFNWCITAARALSPRHSKVWSALRLVADGRVPSSVTEGAKVLKDPVADLAALDDAVLNQFGLPLWPFLTASREGGKVILRNAGVGVAIAVRAVPAGTLFRKKEASSAIDLPPGETMELTLSGRPTVLDVRFVKFRTEYRYKLPITAAKKNASAFNGVDGTRPDIAYYDWAQQADLCRAAGRVLGVDESPNKGTISRAVRGGQLQSNGKSGRKCLVNVGSFKAWIAKKHELENEEVLQISDAIMSELRSHQE